MKLEGVLKEGILVKEAIKVLVDIYKELGNVLQQFVKGNVNKTQLQVCVQ